jgi:Chaperone of endosialidase
MKLISHQKGLLRLAIVALTIALAVGSVLAQTTSFTYQGRLTDGGNPANGNYDVQFALFDSLSGGTQIGSTQTLNTVPVSNGVFTVSLDFGASSFNGGNRFLAISARASGSGLFTLLTPRQQVMATPYAVRSVSAGIADSATTATNATQLGGVVASQYVQTNDTRLSDARTPLPDSSNYIQNTTNQQSSTNFNVSGNGTVGGTLSGNAVNASTHFNIGGNPVLSVSGDNLFAGPGTGQANTTGNGNAFVGSAAGNVNKSGSNNSFFGNFAGEANVIGGNNTLIGSGAGGGSNDGNNNTAVGASTGATSGANNTTLVGYSARALAVGALENSTAIGANAIVTQSNSLVLGSTSNTGIVNITEPDTNVGIGTTAPSKRLEVFTFTVADGINLAGTAPAYFLAGTNKSEKGGLGFAGSAGLYSTDAAAGDLVLRSLSGRLLLQHGMSGADLIINSTGTVSVPNFGSGGTASVCRNSTNGGELAFCSSSLRYKTSIANFAGGMNIINQLRPISFEWKQNRMKDIGLGAEEVEKVEPLLTFRNDKGEIEGVRYDRLGVLFVNAFKEQQQQIEQQREQLDRQETQIKQERAIAAAQQRQLEALKALVCRSHRRASVCR